jgi:ParB family chromosome partitioning protein
VARTLTSDRSNQPTQGADVSDTQFVGLDPSKIKIGANVRTDLHADAKEFARSIKERGVLEPVTVYVDEDGAHVVVRGQRRTVVAAEVGLTDIPAQVVPKPDEADRITDQMVENLHRAAMRDSEIVGGVEQLALVGVSAAQIARRAALPRETVNAALAVAEKEQTRARVVSGDLTLQEAAIFAEFEHDPPAVEELERARSWGRPLAHAAQRLRDEARERAAVLAEIDRLRADGLPVLDPDEVRDVHRLRLSDLVRASDGEPIPENEWPSVPGAAVVVVSDWEYPERHDEGDDPAEDTDEDGHDAEPVQVFTPVWICRDPEAAGLVQRWNYLTGPRKPETSEADQEAAAEAAREERRRVIANNKAWASAEVVRRDWLRQFLTRKTPPKGAEALICEAVVSGQFTLTKAMDAAHPMLRELLGLDTASVYGGGRQAVERLADQQASPKAATMTTLAAVVAAWEASSGKHTWRNSTAWDARVLGALAEWGYQPSEVESLLLGPTTDDQPTGNEPTDDQPVAV